MPFKAEIAQIVALVHESWPPRMANSSRLASLLRLVPAVELKSLDWGLAPSWETGHTTESWMTLFKKHCSGADGWAWLAIASGDRSGFVREAATRMLGLDPPAEALPFLMLRTADWVPQVRLAAEGALAAYYPAHPYGTLLPTLGVALGIESRLAGPRTSGARALLEWVGRAEDGFLIQALEAGDVRAARWSLRLLVERQSVRLGEAVRAALTHELTSVRFEAANALGNVPLVERRDLLELALADRIGFVRRAALQAVPLHEVSGSAVERLLIDSNRSIREVARREYSRRNPGTSPAVVYRGLLGSRVAAERASALTGLGEVGGEEDAAEAVVRLEDESYRVRAAALRSLAQLSAADGAQAALAALDDSSHKVVALAAAISARHPSVGLRVAAEKLIFSGDVFRHRVGMRLLRVGELEHQAAVLATLLAEPTAQGEALSLLDKHVTVRLVGGRVLPAALVRRLADAVSGCQVPEEWRRQEVETRQRQRILFALRSSL